MLCVGVFYTQLPLGVGAHSINQMRACNENRVGCATGYLDYGDVVRAESRYHVDLPLCGDLFAEAELPEAVGTPGEDLREIRFIGILHYVLSDQTNSTLSFILLLLGILCRIFPFLFCCHLSCPCSYVVDDLHAR